MISRADIWEFVKGLTARVARLEDQNSLKEQTIAALQKELASIKALIDRSA